MGVPLKKGNEGQDVRPILIGEALMAVPAGCLKKITQKKAVSLLSPMQFGVGVAGGAESMILQARALSKIHPDDAYCGLDMVNAFGEISIGLWQACADMTSENKVAIFSTLGDCRQGHCTCLPQRDSAWWTRGSDSLACRPPTGHVYA